MKIRFSILPAFASVKLTNTYERGDEQFITLPWSVMPYIFASLLWLWFLHTNMYVNNKREDINMQCYFLVFKGKLAIFMNTQICIVTNTFADLCIIVTFLTDQSPLSSICYFNVNGTISSLKSYKTYLHKWSTLLRGSMWINVINQDLVFIIHTHFMHSKDLLDRCI